MVSRDQWLKYGAMLLIVVFVGETIFLGLSSAGPSADSNGVPSATPLSFSGTTAVRGKVIQLGYSALALCNSSTKLDEQLRSVPGVRTALFASPEVLAVQFEPNATLDFVQLRVAEVCQAPLFRSASVDLAAAQLELNTTNGTQQLSTRQLDAYFSNQGFSGFQAFVSPSLAVGDEVRLTVAVVVQDDQFVSVTAQQPEADIVAALDDALNDVPAVVPESGNASGRNVSASSPVASGSNASQ